MGKVIGKPYRGEPDVRFDEGAEGNDLRHWAPGQALKGHWRAYAEFASVAVGH